MTTAAIALVVASAALVAVGILIAAVLGGHRASKQRLDESLRIMSARMDALAGELSTAVERTREEALRARIVESLGQALDLDEVLTRCAEAAASLQGVAAATITLEVDGAPMFAAAGLDRAALVGAPCTTDGPPDGARVRAVGISYHYPPGAGGTPAFRSGIAVPVESGGTPLGFLTVFGAGEDPPVAGDDFRILESIVRHAGPAIEAARRRGAPVRRLPGIDGLTGLGSRHALHETLALEVARACRHGRRLAFCVLDVDDFRHTNSRVGQIAGDGLLGEVATVLRDSIPPSGIAFRAGGDEFAVVLPGCGRIEAEALYARVQATLLERSPAGLRLSLSAGIAELKPDDDGVSLFERAERALRRAKETGKGTAA
jgi:diguanylate cyclase (GGDEF)-like protein